MITSREISVFLIITFLFAITISFIKSVEIFLHTLLAVFLVLLINIVAKKIAAFYLDSEIEINFWEITRYGFSTKSYFKKPFPSGIFFPILFSAFSLGNLLWMASIIFEVKPKVYRAAKRHGLYSFSEMTESHIGLIAAAGVVANLVFAVLGYFIGFSDFAKLNVFLAFFNMLPFSDLDGNKIFFGNLALWSLLLAIVLLGLGYVFFLI